LGLMMPHTGLVNTERVHARYHFTKPSRIVLSKIEFRDEILRTSITNVGDSLKQYKISLGRPEASIEVVAENTSWIEW
jgi:hypothetical protein